MANKRRELIKSLGLGTAWATPVVQSVVIPAHAQTSATTTAAPTTTPIPCSAPVGCYGMSDGYSFQWPGGSGVQAITYYSEPQCESSNTIEDFLIVARTEAEAISLFGGGVDVVLVITEPALDAGCNFYRPNF